MEFASSQSGEIIFINFNANFKCHSFSLMKYSESAFSSVEEIDTGFQNSPLLSGRETCKHHILLSRAQVRQGTRLLLISHISK